MSTNGTLSDVLHQLTICQLSDGRITVNGPIQNKFLCYALLACAQDAVRDFADKQQRAPLIAPVTIMPKFNQ